MLKIYYKNLHIPNNYNYWNKHSLKQNYDLFRYFHKQELWPVEITDDLRVEKSVLFYSLLPRPNVTAYPPTQP